MSIRSLNKLRSIRTLLIRARRAWLIRSRGVMMERTTSVSLSSRFIAGRRGDIIIGAETLIAFKTLIYSQDLASGAHRPVRIGRHCFIGGGSVITPGVTIGDGSIVGAGSVVFDNVPPRSIVAGNPARILHSGVELGPYGRLEGANESIRKMWR